MTAKEKQWCSENMGRARETLSVLFPDIERDRLDYHLEDFSMVWSAQPAPLKEIAARKAFHAVSQGISRNLRMKLLTPIRKLRQSGVPQSEAHELPSFAFNQMVQTIASQGNEVRRYPGAKTWAFVYSFDIDQQICADNLERCSTYLHQRDMVASFNMLTGGEYQFERAMTEQLLEQGHEVGLHGHVHDIAIGYRSEQNIRRQITTALNTLGLQPRGYRAPALAASMRLFKVLKDHDFDYDSSLPASNKNLPSVSTTFPYRLDRESDFFELPVALQDSTLFLDYQLDKQSALSYVERFAMRCRAQHAPFVFNLHPYVFAHQTDFFEDLVAFIESCDDVWVCRQDQLVDHFRSNLLG